MSMPCSRNLIIPLWFVVFALAAFVLPAGAASSSLLLLVLGLTVPAIFYVLWQDPPLQRSRGRRRTDSQRTT